MRALAGSWLARKIKKKQGKIKKKQFCYAGVGWLLVGNEK